MKKIFNIKLIAVVLLLATLVTGCTQPEAAHEHVWTDATCSAPKKCECGATEGEPLAHTWVDADYSNPKTCSVCGATEGEKLVSPIPEHLNLALAIDDIPVAKPGMTEDELRDLIVQYMYLQINFAYTPDFGAADEYGYYIVNLYDSYGYQYCKIPFREGEYYGGIPYVGNAAGSLYRWLEFYDAESGVMNWEPLIRTRRKNWEAEGRTFPDVGSAYFGNSCAASAIWSMLRVTNEIDTFWTSTWLPKNGFVKVGDYDLTDEDTHGSQTKDLVKENGKQRMYEAYALLKRADGLVHTGHAMLCASDAVVVRDANGNIDEEKSYVTISEQTTAYLMTLGGTEYYSPLGDSGITYRIQGNYPGNKVCGQVKSMKKTFKTLYNAGCLPFTIPELCGQAEVEIAEPKLYKSGALYEADAIKASEIRLMTIECNYAISDIHFIIRDAEGNEVFNTMYAKFANDVMTLKKYSLNDALLHNALYENSGIINVNVFEYAEVGGCTLEITARVSTGELLTVYKGKLEY